MDKGVLRSLALIITAGWLILLSASGKLHAAGWNDSRLPAPTVTTARAVFLTLGHSALVDSVHWSSVKHAKKYRVTIASDQPNTPDLVFDTDKTTLAVGLPPGGHRVRVLTINWYGILGQPSPPVEVRVVKVSLPKGAFADQQGIVHIAPGERAYLSHAAGLKVTYGRMGILHPSRGWIELDRGQPTWVRIRHPEKLEPPAFLRLVPRDVKAVIRVSPTNPVWPRDRIDIHVRLIDSRGRPPPSWIEARPEVLVGIRPVGVPWRRLNSNEWVASLGPQGSEPKVVRVIVKDQFGIQLGRTFVEVENTSSKEMALQR